MKNHYQSLGLKSNATLTEIKMAYRKLALKFHPDQNDGDLFFEDRFKEIQEAYEILSDGEKRNIYDINFDGFYRKTFGNSDEDVNKHSNDLDSKAKSSLTENDKNIMPITILFSLGIIAIIVLMFSNKNSTNAEIIDIKESNQTEKSSFLIESSKDSTRSQAVPEIEIISKTPVIEEQKEIFYNDNDALKYLKEEYDFYRRDYIFRNPKFKKINRSVFEISIEECINKESFIEGDFHWSAKVLILEIYNDGAYSITDRRQNLYDNSPLKVFDDSPVR